MNLGTDDAEGHARLAALAQGSQELGWSSGFRFRREPLQGYRRAP
jgi:hypothetical protein